MPQVLVVGAGPAGAGLAYLLALRGFEVTLLERQRDFSREFRGEFLMPSGIEALDDAARAVEAERLPEIAAIQRLQALPPRIVFSRAWWGDPLRHAIAGALRLGIGGRLAASRANLFLFGAAPVRLPV